MTQEEKAKAYDKAIQKLRGMMPNWECLSYNGKTFLQDLINIFPELTESKDEEIRKEILEYFQQFEDEELRGVDISDWIAWLEKQGEQNPTDKVDPKFHEGDIVQYITDSTDRRKIKKVDTLWNMYHTDSSPIIFEIQDEWKVVANAEDVEQKPAKWSEEDESMRTRCIGILGKCYTGELPIKVEEELNWLKSLKPQNTWKPNE